MSRRSLLFFRRAELMVVLVIVLGVGLTVSLWAFLPPRSAKTQHERPSSPEAMAISVSSATGGMIAPERQQRTQRTDTIERTADYVGPPTRENYTPQEKFRVGTVVDINTADSITLTKIPGIGPAFARRIIRYRQRLGGYYTVLQLQEVYGMDYDRYCSLKRWFAVRTPAHTIQMETLRCGNVPQHPYLSWKQRAAIDCILRREGKVSHWAQLLSLPAFTQEDSIRLCHYFRFGS